MSLCLEDQKTIKLNQNVISVEKTSISNFETQEYVKDCSDDSARNAFVTVFNDDGIRNAMNCAK